MLLVSCAVSRHEAQYAYSPEIQSDYSEVSYYNFILAIEAELSHDWDEALKYLKLALEEDPDSAYLKTEISRVYLRMQRTEDAIRTALEVIDKSPDYEPALSLLARLYTGRKDYPKAIGMYKRLIRLDPSNIQPYVHLAYMYMLDEKIERAIEILNDAEIGRAHV